MPTYNPSQVAAAEGMRLGIKVEKAAISVLGATTKDVFKVVGGNCIFFGIYGISTTGQGVGANAVTWNMTPTVGTAINLSGGVGDIVSQEAGGFVSLTGVLADNTLISTGRVPTYESAADASTRNHRLRYGWQHGRLVQIRGLVRPG